MLLNYKPVEDVPYVRNAHSYIAKLSDTASYLSLGSAFCIFRRLARLLRRSSGSRVLTLLSKRSLGPSSSRDSDLKGLKSQSIPLETE